MNEEELIHRKLIRLSDHLLPTQFDLNEFLEMIVGLSRLNFDKLNKIEKINLLIDLITMRIILNHT